MNVEFSVLFISEVKKGVLIKKFHFNLE